MRNRTRLSIALLVMSLALSVGQAGASPKVQVVPHRALYDMSLISSRPRSGIVEVTGVLSFKWGETCDGWTVEQRYKLRMLSAGGPETEIRTNYVSWESKDGLNYRFNLRNQRDGVTSEEFRGAAGLAAKGQAGSARYSRPDGREEPLPAGTVFPTEHTEILIERALAGKRLFTRTVFDGTREFGAMLINAFIGGALQVSPEAEEPLTNVRGWRMRLAFFPLERETESPEYEVEIELQENGIARSVELDYGDFTIRGVLSHLEPLPRPGC